VVLIRPLNRTFFLLALVGGGTTSFDHDAALAQTLDRRSDACSGIPNTRERVPVWPDQWPWSSIGRVNIATITRTRFCTGSLVGPRTVITAAHCMFDDRLNEWFKPNLVHFVAGLSPGLKYSGQILPSVDPHQSPSKWPGPIGQYLFLSMR
jgi:V8-like Glu-specific endopeptidase